MFRDKEEELARLEELLEEVEELLDETEELPQEEEPEFLEEPSGDTKEYKNFANDYGKVNIYNTDTTDLDLEEYAEEVYDPTEPKNTGLLVTAALLLVGIFLVLGWWAIRFLGVL